MRCWTLAGIESFVALERSIGLNQHLLQASQFETGETVSQHVILEGAIHSDPTLQGRLGEFGLQLLKAGQPEHEAMKGGQEDGRSGNFRTLAGIGKLSGGGAKIENLTKITSKGGEFVNRSILPSHKCKLAADGSAIRSISSSTLSFLAYSAVAVDVDAGAIPD
jgi:hypothetical protein